jgi:hypothetical protein
MSKYAFRLNQANIHKYLIVARIRYINIYSYYIYIGTYLLIFIYIKNIKIKSSLF